MRSYGTVKPTFWNGRTGREIRAAGGDVQLLALYLITNPHTNAIGYYYLPLDFALKEVAMSRAELTHALDRLVAIGFCAYDPDAEVVWVREMAFHQLGAHVSPNDKRRPAVDRMYQSVPRNRFLGDFHERYGSAYSLTERPSDVTPLHTPLGEEKATSVHAPSGGAPEAPGSDLVPVLDPVLLEGCGKPFTTTAPGEPQPAAPTPTTTAAVIDSWFDELIAIYPPQGRTNGESTKAAFRALFRRDPRAPPLLWAEIRAAAENHIQSGQWARGMIPSLLNWLREGKYAARLPPASAPSNGRGRTGAAPPGKYDRVMKG